MTETNVSGVGNHRKIFRVARGAPEEYAQPIVAFGIHPAHNSRETHARSLRRSHHDAVASEHANVSLETWRDWATATRVAQLKELLKPER